MTKNLGLKAFSLLLALVLAYAVNSESNAGVVTVVVPIEFQGLPLDRVVTRPTKRSIQVTLKGPSFILGSVTSAPPSIKVKLPQQLDDRLPVTFKSSDLHLPPGVDVLSFEPPETELTLETIENKEVRVEVPRIGQLPAGFSLDGIQISPRTIILKGPRTEIRQLKSIETEPVDLRDLDESRKVELRIRLPGGQTTASIERISALVEVSQVPTERTFKSRGVELRAVPGLGGLKLDPLEVTVTVAAPPGITANLDATAIIPFVRVKEKPPNGAVELSVDVEMPRDCRVIRVDPPKITVRTDSARVVAVRPKNSKGR